MRRAPKLVLLALAQVTAALSLAQPAHAETAKCYTGYDRISQHAPWVNYEDGLGYGSCPGTPVARIDVRLTYVYCPTSTSCNSTGSNFAGTSSHDVYAHALGSISNLRGWYKVIVRTSFTLYPGQWFSWDAGNNMDNGGCGLSSTNYWSCAYESRPFERGV